MLGGVLAFFKALAMALGMIERHQEQAIGAQMQRGKDAENELDRITAANDAGERAASGGVPAGDPLDRSRRKG